MVVAAPPPLEVHLPEQVQVQELGRVDAPLSEQTLSAIRARIPNTKILEAWPSKVPGLIALKLENGRVAYTDESARFFILGLIFDLDSGQGLDGQMDAIETP